MDFRFDNYYFCVSDCLSLCARLGNADCDYGGEVRGAENGVLIKSGDALETTHKIQTIVFDKTGTITEGKPVVTDILVADSALSEAELLTLAASAEQGSEHPLGEAIGSG